MARKEALDTEGAGVVVSWPLAQDQGRRRHGGRGPVPRRRRPPLPHEGLRGHHRARDREGGAHAAGQPALPLPDEGQPAPRPHEARRGADLRGDPRRHPRRARPRRAAASRPAGAPPLPPLAAGVPGGAVRVAFAEGSRARGDDPAPRPVRGLLVGSPLRSGRHAAGCIPGSTCGCCGSCSSAPSTASPSGTARTGRARPTRSATRSGDSSPTAWSTKRTAPTTSAPRSGRCPPSRWAPEKRKTAAMTANRNGGLRC